MPSAATVKALPVEPVGKIVSASTRSGEPSRLTPNPLVSVTLSFSTMAMAMPGTPICLRRLSTRASNPLGGAATAAEMPKSANKGRM